MPPVGAPGTTLSHFRIEAELGRGGMGVVYRATDLLLGRPVALKVVRATAGGGEDPAIAQRRFLREAQLAGALNHPALVTVYSYEAVGDDALIAMELLDGETLAQQLARRVPWNPVHTAMLLAAVCDGVAEAHRAGIVHRDLKPGNIMLLPDGRVKVLDFGIAAPTQHAGDRDRRSPIIGTVEYMAPEQVTGGDVAPPADVFALGAIAYEMITLERAFGGGTTEQIAVRVAGDDPPLLADARTADAHFGVMRSILERMLAKDPARRFHDAAVLLEALQPIAYQMSPESGAVIPVTVVDPHTGQVRVTGARRPPRKVVPTVLVAAFAITLIVATGGTVLYLLGGPLLGRIAGVTPPAATQTRRARPPGPVKPPVVLPIAAPAGSTAAPGDSARAAPPHRVLISSVEVLPEGSTIRRVDKVKGRWTTRAELAVAEGDSIPLVFEHPKWNSKRAWFRGRPMRVTLAGGTGTVLLTSTVASSVEVRAVDGNDVVLASGTTPLTARLAPGTYRATFRARSFDDSTKTLTVRDGEAKTVSVAYAATGVVRVAGVGGAAATVRIDGGDARAAPAEFAALSPGRHIVTVERGSSVARDTVMVFPGRTVTRRVAVP